MLTFRDRARQTRLEGDLYSDGTPGDVLTVQPGGKVTPAPAGGAQTFRQSAPVTLTAADLLAIKDAPIKVVDAPGSGLAIAAMFASAQYVPGLTAFGENTVLRFVIGATGKGWFGYDDVPASGVMQALTPNLNLNPLVWITSPPADRADWDNAAIYATAAANATLGDGSLIVTLYYALLAV